MGTNTGTGGFEVDGKVYTYDVGDPDAAGIDGGSPNHGDIDVDNDVKDISKRTKKTLGQYLKGITKVNAYPLDGSYVETSLTDENGTPHPLADDPTNDPQFTTRSAAAGVVADNPDLRSSIDRPVADPATSLNISKGRETPQLINGNSLLSSVAKDSLPDPIATYTTSIISNNRFTDAARLNNGNVDRPDPGFNPTFRVPGRGEVSALVLAQVGAGLSLRSSGEFPFAFTSGFNPTGAEAAEGALIPSPNQLGVLKVNNVLLQAADVLDNIVKEEVPPGSLTEISPIGDQSWGNLNNVEEPFAGLLNLGQVALALALTVALGVVFESLGALLALGGAANPKDKKSGGLYTLGSYTSEPLADPNKVGLPPSLFSLLNIRPTLFPFGDALKTGTAAYFLGAAHAQDSAGNQLKTAFLNSAASTLSDSTNAGANIIVARTIIRSGLTIAESVSSTGKAFASNPIAGVKSIVGLLSALRDSRLFAAINVFASLGDAVLSESLRDTSPDNRGKLVTSRTDAINNDASYATVQKNRLKDTTTGRQTTKLAWSSNRAPSMYLIPDSTMTMQLLDTKLGAFRGPVGLADPLSRTVYVAQSLGDQAANGARIARDSEDPDAPTVQALEAMLDAEYVPFYFHDLRTNEIISFHAFIASLSDDFNANWETTDAIGRVDPIKIYKSTSRRINISFYVAATSENDFDDMWMKLNKLVTLVYPQYTRGRGLALGNNTTFFQPFSQLIGASPLVRLRLGDLIRSNYSRFALARLFGADSGLMKVDNNSINFSGAADKASDLRKALAAARETPSANFKYVIASPGHPAATSTGISLPGAGPKSPTNAPAYDVEAGDLQFFQCSVKSFDPLQGNAVVVPELLTADDITARFGVSANRAQAIYIELRSKYDVATNPKQRVVGGTYSVPKSDLALTVKSYNDITKQVGIVGVENIDLLSTFLDENKNALVRSFKSVKGKGLAGAIESLNFDWYDKTTWETTMGRAAPKLCKVTLGFSPIHDISPGIDANGYNRAPVYPVGAAMAHSFDAEKAKGG